MPRADDLPSFDLGFNGTRCTTNPLGVKGCGEAGAIAAFPAIANAILDALAPLGVTRLRRAGDAGARLAGDAGGAMRRHAPAAARNRQPILDVLRQHLPAAGLVLEVASGSGEHVVHFAAALPRLVFQPSDPDSDARASIDDWARDDRSRQRASRRWRSMRSRRHGRSSRPTRCSACNMIHIAPWQAATGPDRRRRPPAVDGRHCSILYGPYRRGGRHTAPSNDAFDRDLRRRNPAWGVRDLEEVAALADDERLRRAARSSRCRPTISR